MIQVGDKVEYVADTKTLDSFWAIVTKVKDAKIGLIDLKIEHTDRTEEYFDILPNLTKNELVRNTYTIWQEVKNEKNAIDLVKQTVV